MINNISFLAIIKQACAVAALVYVQQNYLQIDLIVAYAVSCALYALHKLWEIRKESTDEQAEQTDNERKLKEAANAQVTTLTSQLTTVKRELNDRADGYKSQVTILNEAYSVQERLIKELQTELDGSKFSQELVADGYAYQALLEKISSVKDAPESFKNPEKYVIDCLDKSIKQSITNSQNKK